ncbi:hypothetical protein H8D36_00850 [archaeon]|nr:hypothetical protein [archaeon]MBL7056696.1 hypothetical protein [Candidatus Woesearchaeota archaeon]
MGLENIFEIALLVFLVLGVIFSLILNNLVLQCLAIFVFGILVVVVSGIKRLELNFPYVFVVIGFILGYLISSTPGHRWLVLVIFLVGIVVGLILRKVLKTHIDMKK